MRRCHRHHQPEGGPCTCEMGNLYRFAEPIVLLAVTQLGEAHGYQIAQQAEGMAVTHAGLDSGIIYRTLRRLEAAGRVKSSWDTSGPGPARRVYVLTGSGVEHLGEWAVVLKDVAASLQALGQGCSQPAPRPTQEETRPAKKRLATTGSVPRRAGTA